MDYRKLESCVTIAAIYRPFKTNDKDNDILISSLSATQEC